MGSELIGCILPSICPATFIPEIAMVVADFLTIRPVGAGMLTALSCSGTLPPGPMYSYHRECTLEPGNKSCWISTDVAVGETGWIVYELAAASAAVGAPAKRRVDQ